jgi:translation initiation factor 4G
LVYTYPRYAPGIPPEQWGASQGEERFPEEKWQWKEGDAAEKAAVKQQAVAPPIPMDTEEGETGDEKPPEETSAVPAVDQDIKAKAANKEILRMDTGVTLPVRTKRRPAPLDLSKMASSSIPAPLLSALSTARVIKDLGCVPYPEGVKSPSIELNVNAQKGKFR